MDLRQFLLQSCSNSSCLTDLWLEIKKFTFRNLIPGISLRILNLQAQCPSCFPISTYPLQGGELLTLQGRQAIIKVSLQLKMIWGYLIPLLAKERSQRGALPLGMLVLWAREKLIPFCSLWLWHCFRCALPDASARCPVRLVTPPGRW